MKKFLRNFNSVLVLFFAAAFMFSIVSCGEEEEIPGCTDVDGDQYNVEATVDNGTCTYFDRFVGTYEGTFACPGALMGVFVGADLVIAESVSATNDVVSVTVISPSLPGPLPLIGVITKNDVTITATLPNIPLALAGLPPGLIVNINVSGVLVRQADGSLSGTVMVSLQDTTGTLMLVIGTDTIGDNCPFTAVRK